MERVLALYRLTQGRGGAQGPLAALRSASTNALTEPGCLSSRVWRDPDDGGDFLLVEEWETPRILEHYMRSPPFRRFLEVLELSKSPPGILYVEGLRWRGLDWLMQVLGSDGEGPTEAERPMTPDT